MGARSSPEITDIRMKDIADDVISTFQHADKLFYHGRYRNDGFIVLNGSPDEIKEFLTYGILVIHVSICYLLMNYFTPVSSS